MALFTEKSLHLGFPTLARIISLARAVADAGDRSEREHLGLWASAMGLAAVSGNTSLYYSVPDAHLACLQRVAGHKDWLALAHVQDPNERSLQAFMAAHTRFEATPEAERIASPSEAIKNLAGYVVFSIAISSRTNNTQLAESLPEVLVPFSPLSPLVSAMEHNARASAAAQRGRRQKARELFRTLYDDLGSIEDQTGDLVPRVQAAVALALARMEAGLGLVPDPRWLDTKDPAQLVSTEYVRKVAALHRGDWEAAEAHRRKAELLSLERNAVSMFSTLSDELEVHALARELTGLNAVRARIQTEAEADGRWRSTKHLADAYYYQLCGDWDGALSAVADLYADTEGPGRVRHMATTVEVEALRERGDAERALQLGLAAHADALADDNRHVARSLALALAMTEIDLGELDSARRRVEQVIAEQEALGVVGLLRGKSAECLARVELAAGDREVFERAAADTALYYRPGESAVLGALYARLMECGQGENDPLPDCEDPTAQLSSQVEMSLLSSVDAPARATEALRMLCDEAAPRHGYLFLLAHDGLTLHASNRRSEHPEALRRFALSQLDQELEDDTCTMTVATDQASLENEGSHWFEGEERFFSVPLLATDAGSLFAVGIAVVSDTGEPIHRLRSLAEAIAGHLLASGEYLPRAAD